MLLTTSGITTMRVRINGPVGIAQPEPRHVHTADDTIGVMVTCGTLADHTQQTFTFTGDTEALREFVRSLQWAVELAESHRVHALEDGTNNDGAA